MEFSWGSESSERFWVGNHNPSGSNLIEGSQGRLQNWLFIQYLIWTGANLGWNNNFGNAGPWEIVGHEGYKGDGEVQGEDLSLRKEKRGFWPRRERAQWEEPRFEKGPNAVWAFSLNVMRRGLTTKRFVPWLPRGLSQASSFPPAGRHEASPEREELRTEGSRRESQVVNPQSPPSHRQPVPSLKLETTCKPEPRPRLESPPWPVSPNLLKQKVVSVRSIPCVLMLLASVRNLHVFWAVFLVFY